MQGNEMTPEHHTLVAQIQYLQNRVNELERENRQKIDSMETDDLSVDNLSEPDSEESDIDVGSDLKDAIIAIEKAFGHTIKM
jgi:hypothetical protein